MSAIAGIWRLEGGPDAARDCARMLGAQAMLGPDGQGIWDGGSVSLGRRMTRLVPEDAFDTQPLIAGPAARRVMVADVRLDNRAALQAELDIDPRRAWGLCDAALLLAAWERWEADCFGHLVGDYAFAMWDAADQSVWLARDPIGQRPLHYSHTARKLAWASTPMGLHALPGARIAIDEDRMAGFLALAPERGPASFYQDIMRVEPGQAVRVTRGGLTTRRHWTPARRTLRLARAEDYVEALRERLDEAVRVRLRGAEATVGAHLSSGWDSAAVAATAARLLAAMHGRVIAYTAVPRPGYDIAAPRGRHGDEGVLAADVAALYGNIEHVRIASGIRSPLDDLDGDSLINGRPTLNPCNQVWGNAINRDARARGIRVMLTGDYGNLTLTDDGVDGLADLAHLHRLGDWWRNARALQQSGALRWRGVFAASFGDRVPRALWTRLRQLNGERIGAPGAYSALRADRWPTEVKRGWRDRFQRRLDALAWRDPATYGKGALARWGIDLRDPLGDLRLVEFCQSIPIEELLVGGRPRSLARRALADRLPESLLDSPTRGYQAVDWHEGLTVGRPQLKAELNRLKTCAPVQDLIDLPRLQQLADNWPVDGWSRDVAIADYRYALLRGAAAGRFVRRASGSNQ